MTADGQALTIGAEVSGKVRHIGIYGALVDIGTGQDALLHVSQLSQIEAGGIEEGAQLGSPITAYVYKTRGDGHVVLSLERPPLVPWGTIRQGRTYSGRVVRVEDFGVFVDFGAERPGMVHVSEMSDNYVRAPGDVAEVGQEVEVRVIKKNGRSRQIDLTMKSAPEEALVNEADDDEEAVPTSMAQAFRRAMQSEAPQDEAGNHRPGARSNHRDEQEEILARTLRGTQT